MAISMHKAIIKSPSFHLPTSVFGLISPVVNFPSLVSRLLSSMLDYTSQAGIFPKIKTLIFLTTLILLSITHGNLSAQNSKAVVYLIPGQGGDYRLYKNINIDSTFETRNIEYFTPEKGWNMTDFARELSKQIDTSRAYILVGVSLGGMLATEMGDFLNPKKIILISSAKSRYEFPGRYRFQKKFPIYKLVPPGAVKIGALALQPIVEPARARHKETFVSMLKDKDPKFLKRTVGMIMQWERVSYREDIIHIHGDNDHTIPFRNVKLNYLIENGSHMMVLTKADEISALLNQILLEPTLPY